MKKTLLLFTKRYIYLIIFLLSILASLISPYLLVPSHIKLFLSLQTESNGYVQIYFSEDGELRESDSQTIPLKSSKDFEEYLFTIPIKSLKHVRIDPINSVGEFKINKISYNFMRYKKILESKHLFHSLEQTNGITIINTEEGEYHSKSESEDPQIDMNHATILKEIESYITKKKLFISCSVFISTLLFCLLTITSKIKRFVTKKNIFLINILITIMILLLPPDGISYIKIFAGFFLIYMIPGYLLLRFLKIVNFKTPIYKLSILSITVGISLWFVSMYITSELSIPIPSNFVYAIATCLLIYFSYTIYVDYIKHKTKSRKDISEEDIILIILFNILLYIYIIPTKGLLVAPLHDPAGIAVYAKRLIESNYKLRDLAHTYSFYPPASYHLIALVSDITKVDTSKMIMVITNFFNVLTGVSFALLIKTILKKRFSATIALIVFSFISTFPGSLYFLAGKNAQIIGYFFLFTSLYLFYKGINGKLVYKILFGLVVTTSILIHYNNILITIIMCCGIYIYKILKEKQINIKFHIRDLIKWIPIIICVAVLFYLQFKVIRSVEYSTSNILSEDLSRQSIISFKSFFNWFEEHKGFAVKNNSYTVLRLSELSYVILTFIFFYKLIRYKKPVKTTIFVYILLLLFYLSLYINVSAITRYFLFNRFIIHIIPITFLLDYIFHYSWNKKTSLPYKYKLYIVLIIFTMFYSGHNLRYLWQQYKGVRNYSLVTSSDLKAFKWINENIPAGTHFIPASITDISGNNQTFLQDSSLYFKAYTNSYELFAFVYGNEIVNEKNLRPIYVQLIQNPCDSSAIKEFTNSGVFYIFSGSHKPWGCGDLSCTLFDSCPNRYSVVYNIEGVTIYKIINTDD